MGPAEVVAPIGELWQHVLREDPLWLGCSSSAGIGPRLQYQKFWTNNIHGSHDSNDFAAFFSIAFLFFFSFSTNTRELSFTV